MFRSKIGIGLIIPIVLVISTVLFITIYNGLYWFGPLILLPFIAFIAHMYLNTWYKIQDDKLEIKCGLFFHVQIYISSIKRIAPSTSPLSSPALSFDRLKISYGKFDEVLISPKDKQAFITAILDINSEIEIQPLYETIS